MKKKIIALAVPAVLCAPVLAQENVQVYGVFDVGAARIDAGGKETRYKVDSGVLRTSRLGFKGSEDLGNGLKLNFVLEYRLNVDLNDGIGGNYRTDAAGIQGSTSGPARQQLLGLSGSFGTFAFGRMNTTAFDWAVRYTVLGASAFDVTGNNAMAAGSRINPLGDIRLSNVIAYKSPAFAGFRVDANYSRPIEEAAAGNGRVEAAQLGLYYDNGPLSIGAVFENVDGRGSANLTLSSLAFARGAGFPPGATVVRYDDLEMRSQNLGVAYDFGVLKAKATYQRDKFMKLSANKVWGVGVEVPVSAKGTVHAVYSASSVNTQNKADAQGFSLAYTHNLSKRTIAYAGISWQDNERNGTSGIWATAPDAGKDVKMLAAGVTHMF
ncbi:porin [Azonexus sp.]|uniref:porin n=1 Tax=Azonexus sp. TaxID=1872668 RepID=UPI0035AE2ED3